MQPHTGTSPASAPGPRELLRWLGISFPTACLTWRPGGQCCSFMMTGSWDRLVYNFISSKPFLEENSEGAFCLYGQVS